MQRFLISFALLFVGACAARRSCPTVDPQRLADAISREILTRIAAANAAEATTDELGDEVGENAPPVDAPRLRVPVEGRPSLGPSDAPITLVVFSDFECPFCSRVQPTLATLRERYGDRLRIVFRNEPLPFHAHARDAANAAMEAYVQRGDAGFWAMHDRLFANQRALDRDALARYAQEVGLDAARFRAAIASGAHDALIDDDVAIAEQVGANGTPNFFVNGRQIVGAQPVEAFVRLIDRELETANALTASGVAPGELYARLMQDAEARAPRPPTDAGDARTQPDPDVTYRVTLTGREPQRGRPDALVTIVEFSDFQCPFCSRVEPTLARLLERYGDDVRVVWMDNPLSFHENARAAAMAAAEAQAQGGDRKFWAMHDLLFDHQTELTRESLEAFARQLRLNLPRFRRALDSGVHESRIEASQALARRLGALGTPSFFINGRPLAGAQPYESFARLVDAELAEARALVAGGVRRRDVYARVIAEGLPGIGDADGGEGNDR